MIWQCQHCGHWNALTAALCAKCKKGRPILGSCRQARSVISNLDPLTDDTTFSNNRDTWNVSRALRDCRAGKHKLWRLDVAEAYESHKTIEVDEAKVAALVPVKEFEPCVAVIESGVTWIIDGHHRLRAMHRRGDTEFVCYIIEEADAAHYRILYNGKRVVQKATP